MLKARLGTWNFASGNACHATIQLSRPSDVTVSFAWKSSLTDDDRDLFNCVVLPEARRLALGDVERLAQIEAMLLQRESEGLVARVGITEDGASDRTHERQCPDRLEDEAANVLFDAASHREDGNELDALALEAEAEQLRNKAAAIRAQLTRQKSPNGDTGSAHTAEEPERPARQR